MGYGRLEVFLCPPRIPNHCGEREAIEERVCFATWIAHRGQAAYSEVS